MDSPPPDYRLVMRPDKHWPYPTIVSLRRLLKAFLRRYGFEMLSVEEVQREPKPGDPQATSDRPDAADAG